MQRNDGKKQGPLQAPNIRFGIVVSSYYEEITGALLEGARATLKEAGVEDANIMVATVPGSFEIPYGCLSLIKNKCEAIITLGCIVKGETEHDRHIATAVAGGITKLSLEHNVPISLGVLTTNTYEQAVARSTGANNKGIEAARAAIELSLL